MTEVAPEGWEDTVKAMKKEKDIDNPYALAHWMKNKGYKSHKKEWAVKESTKEYEKTLMKIASDRKLKMISKKDKDLLVKLADLMKKSNK